MCVYVLLCHVCVCVKIALKKHPHTNCTPSAIANKHLPPPSPVSPASGDGDGGDGGLYAAIYYGDSDVVVGEPFTITCRIALTEPVQWLKDGVPLETTHRHRAKDDYVFGAVQAEGASAGAMRCDAIRFPGAIKLHLLPT